jgi:DNA-binding IscR family transcriptional regulator
VRLARAARQITLLDVYRAVGRGELFQMHNPNRGCPIGKRIPDALGEFLPKAERAFEQSLAGATVEDVAKKVWPAFFAAK